MPPKRISQPTTSYAEVKEDKDFYDDYYEVETLPLPL